MIDFDYLKRNASSQTCTSRTMVKSGEDFVLTETYEYLIPKTKLDALKEETDRQNVEIINQKDTFSKLEKEGPIDLNS